MIQLEIAKPMLNPQNPKHASPTSGEPNASSSVSEEPTATPSTTDEPSVSRSTSPPAKPRRRLSEKVSLVGPNTTSPDSTPRILSITSNTPFLKKLDPLLRRASFDVDRMPLGEPSLILASQLRYDLFLIVYPIPDMGLAEFLAGAHAEDSPCADTPVLILGEEAQLEELSQRSMGRSVRLASVDQPEARLESIVSSLLGVAHRVPTRVMVHLEVALGDGTTTRLCQSQNISESGMLLRTNERFKIGSIIELGMRIPDDEDKPVAARAEVVRHAVNDVEGLTGIGVRFVDMSPFNHDRLKRYLGQLSKED